MLTTPMYCHPLYQPIPPSSVPPYPQHDIKPNIGQYYHPHHHHHHHRPLSSPTMSEPQNRQRLRPWLEAKINSSQFPGLEWINKSQAIFKIPWKHGGKQDWSESDSLIFKEWALHTGRFRDGIDPPDWPSWKTRLRCALNKLPDIQEIKDMSNLDGSAPYRVYRFLPKKGQEVSPPGDHYWRTHNGHSGHHRSPLIEHKSEMTSNIPKTVSETISGDSETGARISSLGSDLGNIDVQDLLPLGGGASQGGGGAQQGVGGAPGYLKEEEMDTGDNLVIDEGPYNTDPNTGAPSHHVTRLSPEDSCLHQLLMLTKSEKEPSDHEILVKLKYRHTEVAGHHVKNPHGCRLFYGPMMDTMVPALQGEMYGPPNLEQLHFPPCDNLIDNQRQGELTTQLLNVLDRGLLLETDNGDIYATRKCRLVIFVSTPLHKHPIKLQRNSPRVKVFDYQEYFLPTLEMAIAGKCDPPVAEILIGFGQDWKSEKEPYNNLLISATVFHARAYRQLSQVDPRLFVSVSDEYDRYLEEFKKLGFGQPS